MKIHKEIVKGSLILLIVFNLYNFLNFVFQASMAHFLSVAEYGVLAALSYLAYSLSIFSESIQTVITRYTSIEEDEGKIKNVMKRALRKVTPIVFIVFVLYLIIAFPLSLFLDISYWLFLLNGMLIFSAFYLPITRGVLQGRRKFYGLGFNLITESVLKLVLSTGLVILGWKVYGALGGVILGPLIALAISLFMMGNMFKSEEKPAQIKDIYNYSGPVFFIMFSLLIFYTIDFLVAQIVFSKEVAGIYSIAAILSKIIFWGTQPVSKALLPLSSSEMSINKKKPTGMFINALIIVAFGVSAALIVFFMFSDFIIYIFSGKTLIESSNILFYLGVGTAILSFANLVALYKISLGHVRNAYFFPVVMILGILLLLIFNDSLIEFSFAFVFASILFLLSSIFILRRPVR